MRSLQGLRPQRLASVARAPQPHLCLVNEAQSELVAAAARFIPSCADVLTVSNLAAGQSVIMLHEDIRADSAGRAAGSRYLSWVHGELMLIVYVGLVPFSVLTAYSRRTMASRWWFQVHRAVNVSTTRRALPQ